MPEVVLAWQVILESYIQRRIFGSKFIFFFFPFSFPFIFLSDFIFCLFVCLAGLVFLVVFWFGFFCRGGNFCLVFFCFLFFSFIFP